MRSPRAAFVLAVLASLLVAGLASAANIRGSARNDVLRGTQRADTIYGGAGNDSLFGRGGNDQLYGGKGADRISCGAGKDVVYADASDTVSRDCEVVKLVSPIVSPPAHPPPPPPPPPPPVELGTHDHPVPVGTAAQIDEAWQLQVFWADPNQTEAILDAQRGDPDSLPEPPPFGYQFLLARVSVTRTAPDPASFSPYSLDLLTTAGRLYDDAGPACGTLLDSLLAEELGEGQSATGNVCWKLAITDVHGVLMEYTDPFTGNVIFFSLGL